MDIFEELAMLHLTLDGREFVNPQFDIESGWACPDFVALNPSTKTVRVVEVSVAYNVRNLVAKVNDCEDRWFRHLRAHFASTAVERDAWTYKVTIYIRRNSNYDDAKLNEALRPSVEVNYFESLGFPWEH